MKVEMAIDLTQNPCNAYVMTITRIIGMRIQLSYDGCVEGSPMAVRSVDSPDLFPLGWCNRQGGQLLAPPGMVVLLSFSFSNVIIVFTVSSWTGICCLN